MSFVCVKNYLRDQIPSILQQLHNGECRFLALPGESDTDAQGFILSAYAARTEEFFLCSWKERMVTEKEIALQARGLSVIEIAIPASVVVHSSDRCELRAVFSIALETRTLEIAAIARNGVTQKILAFDLKTDEQNG